MNGRRAAAIVGAIIVGACAEGRFAAPNHSALLYDATTTASGPVVFTGAGNIGTCSGGNDDATGRILDGLSGYVFTLGDNAFENGSSSDFANCYQPAWGRQLSRTWAVMGNHDYQSGNATAAFAYFG